MLRNLKSDEPETKWMEEAKKLLGYLVELDYVQACRNTKTIPVRYQKKKKNSESHFPHYLVEFLRIFSTFHLSRVPLYLKQEPLEIKP